jgi:hypothetical protein
MFWNKKEDKGSLPDLPPIQSPFSKDLMPSAPSEEHESDSESQSLPAFPDSPLNRGFSQSAIKNAVSEDEEEPLANQTFNEKTFKTIELEDDSSDRRSSSLPPLPSSHSLSALTRDDEESEEQEEELRPSIRATSRPASIDRTLRVSRVREEEPEEARDQGSFSRFKSSRDNIYVRIDKFNTARRALASAQEQLDQVDSLLRKIREIKLREEQELAGWEKDLSALKSRIQNVAENIFEKAE